MKLLTQDAVIVCDHSSGIVGLQPSQAWVTISGRAVLVDNDPENRPIAGCPNYGATIKPCVNTLQVKQGYSGFVRVGGRAVCLDSVTGLTDGTPPGMVNYTVRSAGQRLAGASS
jgi:hypothetical protein